MVRKRYVKAVLPAPNRSVWRALRTPLFITLAGLCLAGAAVPAPTGGPPPPAPIAAPQQAPKAAPAAAIEAVSKPVPVPGPALLVTGGTWVAQGPGPTLNGQATNIPGNDPVTGAINAIAAHPTDPNTLFIGAVGGGIWRTTNATAANPNWTPLTDGFPSLSYGAIAFDPTDGSNQTLVAGNGQFSNFGVSGIPLAGLLRTTDGGNTWTQLGQATFAGLTITSVGPRGNTILVAVRGGGGGVYRSTDGGATFPLISGTGNLNAGQAFNLAPDPGNNNRFYAGIGGGSGGVFRTDDAGANWVNVTDAAIGALVSGATSNVRLAVSAAAGQVFVGIVNNGRLAGVFTSTNQGGAWTAMDLPQTLDDGAGITNATNASPIVITSAANLPGGMFTGSLVRIAGVTGNTAANGDFTVTLVSANQFSLNGTVGNGAYGGGGAWQAIQGINNGGQGANNFSIAADPTNGNLVYVGGDRQDYFPNAVGATDFTGRLFRGNASVAPGGPGVVPSPQWTALTNNGTASNSAPHADSRNMAFDANNNLIESDDGGIYRRTNPTTAAGDWFSVIGGLQVAEMHDVAYDTNSNILIGGDQDTGVPQQSATGSTTWNSVQTADGGDVGVDVITLAGAGQSIRYSSTQNLGGFGREVYNAANAQIGARVGLIPAGGLAGFVGQFVTPIAVNSVVPAGGLPAGQSVRLVIGGGTNATTPVGAVYEANNAGVAANAAAVNWVQVPTGAGFVSVNRSAVAYGGTAAGVTNPDVLYVGSGSRVFLRSTAGGTLTATSALPIGASTIVDIVLDPSDWRTAYATDTIRVYRTTDAGANWTNVTGNLGSSGEGNFRTLEYVEDPGGHDKLVVGTNAGVFAAMIPTFGCWFLLGEGLPNASVWDLDYDPADDTLAASTMGRGAWTLANISALGIPVLTVPGPVAFGKVCLGETGIETLYVCNTGVEDLEVDSITSSDPQFSVTAPSSGFPVVISPDFCFPFQVLFTPTAQGPQSAVFTITTNSPCTPTFGVTATGTGTVPDIRVVGSTAFGDVCPGTKAEAPVSICNVGPCDLHVTDVSIVNCPDNDFTLVSNPFPATVSPDSCLDVIVAFTPSSAGPKSCDLRITSDDPDTPVITQELTANTPFASIDVPGDLAFAPTVIQSVDACQTLAAFPVSNTGACNLVITEFAISVDPEEFSVLALPSFPIILEPGHVVGEGDLRLAFAPELLDRNRLGEVRITYVSDPITGDTVTLLRSLCGEGVRTGARVLVTAGGVPVPEVKQIRIQRINANRNRPLLDTVDTAKDVPLQTITPDPPCTSFQFHREYATIDNPIQLLPGSYQVSVMVQINGHMQKKTVGFDVSSCDFNATIVVDF